MLGKKPKKKVISEKILGQLREGELAPGDKLASIKDLCVHFSAGQKTVQEALQRLQDEGVIEIRDRSGCYICDDALEQMGAGDSAGSVSSASESSDLKNYLMPRRTGGAAVRLYVTDLEPRRLALWRDVLDDFAGAAVELVSCNEGHLEDVFASESPDVVETTPGILEAVGREKFVPENTIQSVAEIDADSMVAPVRARMESGGWVGGVPFAVTLQYLFVNDELAAEAGIEEPSEDVFEFLEQARHAKRALGNAAADALVLPTCLDPLLMSGSITWTEGRGLELRSEPARRVFELLNEIAPPAASTEEVTTHFSEGRLVYLIHCSFSVCDFYQSLPFDWRAVPLPLASGVQMPGWLSVLAVNRETARPDDCSQLISYLSRPDIQRRFTEIPGNLPVHQSVLGRMSAAVGKALSVSTVERALEQLTLNWPENVHSAVNYKFNLPRLRTEISRGELHIEEALERVQHRLEFVPVPARDTTDTVHGKILT